MAAANTVGFTLADVIREQAPNGTLYPIVQSMSKLCPILDDIYWVECNNGTFHRIDRQTALPSPSRRRVNSGIATVKDETNQVDEVTTQIATKIAVDEDVIRLGGPAFLARRVAAHMMGHVQQAEADFLTGSLASDADGFDGIETRLSATTNTPAGNQVILVDAAAAGSDQGSALLLGWGAHGVHGIYPKGFPAGINHQDFGLQPDAISDGTNSAPGYLHTFKWDYGLAVEDYRYCARAANIDSSAISATGTNIITALITLFHRCLTADQSVRWAYYLPRRYAEFLHQQARSGVSNSTLKIEEIGGKKVTTFLGIPVRTADLLGIAESVVS